MSLKIHDAPAPIGQADSRRNAVSKEALSRLPTLDIGELRQQWRGLYKAEASPHLSRELLVRAVAYRMQEVALGGAAPRAAAPAPPNCAAVQRNRRSHDTRSPGAEARNPG